MNQVTASSAAAGHKGWLASLSLNYAPRREKTAIVERRHVGPLAVQRPFYPEADGTCHTYLLHPPAGIVGGDELAISLDLAADANVLVTTPGANRWYYSDDRAATMTQTMRLGAGARLEWLPQETLVFNGAVARLNSRIELHGDARYCGWEVVCLGRPAAGESFTHGKIDFRLELWHDDVLLLRERLAGDGLPPGLLGNAAFATVIANGADAEALVLAREVCAQEPNVLCGATLIDGVLICRGLAAHCAPLTKLCRAIWSTLRPALHGLEAVAPRIWRT